jgi:hypothetical protein
MSTTEPQKVVCDACGKAGAWRPEFAGKRIKCKCGHVIQVPAAAPAPVEDPNANDAYGLSEDQPAPVRKLPTLAPISNPSPTIIQSAAQSKKTANDAAKAEEKAKFVKVAILLAALVLVIGGAIAGIKILSSHGQKASAGPQLGEDADVEEMLADQTHMEIHAWFQEDPHRIAGPWTPSQALGFADRWQAMGAKQVITFGSSMTTFLAIELPTEPEKRKPLFAWQAQWHSEHFQKVWTDVGQKYLLIRIGV